MKIISNFKDYYDGISAYGIDDLVKYIRTHKVVEDKPFGLRYFVHDHYKDICSANLMFCGKLYPAILEPTDKDKSVEGEVECGNYRSIRAHYEWPNDIFWKAHERSIKKFYWQVEKFNKERFDNAKSVSIDPKCVAIHKKYNSPAILLLAPLNYNRFSGLSIKFYLDPILKNLQFFNQVDAHTAFQEIQMFIANYLNAPDECPDTVGSDKDILIAKGFDDFSFKNTAPGNKKLNRAKNRAKKRGLLKQ